MIPTIAPGPVHARRTGRRVTVIAPVDLESGAIERRQARRQAEALRSCGGHETIACRHPRGIEGLQGTTEGRIMERCGDHAVS
jgi:hypothetical protein